MTKEMDPQLRAHLIERLSHRAARLARVTSPEMPQAHIDVVISLMAGHVMTTAMVLLGEQFTRDMLSELFDRIGEASGICRFCHARPLRNDGTMCQVCWEQAATDDELSDEDIIAMGLDDQSPSEQR